MPRRHHDLFEGVASFAALRAAALRAARGKRDAPGVAAFLARFEWQLLGIEDALRAGIWVPGPYTVLNIKDPKPRRVSAAPFRDRVVHHALCSVIAPLFERGFTDDSFANRMGFGTYRAVERFESFASRFDHVLRADIFRFFPAIDHAVLKQDLRRRIGCHRTLQIIDRIIDGSNPQEPVDRYFPGDDLFTPFSRRRGLPIGNLTSQWFANIYLDPLDHFIRERLRARGYVRYMDDFAVFHDDPGQLAAWRTAISVFLERRRLLLHPRKTGVLATATPQVFLGFLLGPNGRRHLPPDKIARFRSRLHHLRSGWQAGSIGEAEIRQSVDAWIAHARQAQSWHLRHTLFQGGWFDPARQGGRGSLEA